MAATKKVFIGSLFQFTAAAVEEVIESHKQSLPLSVSPPFISYDRQTNLFSLLCDRTDRIMLPEFIGQLKAYIDQQNQRQVKPDFVDSPKIRPIPGTILQDTILLDDDKPDGKALIDHLDSDNTDDEAADVTAGFAHITGYWKPNQCDIRDLSTDLAHEIAQLTGADLFAEPDRSRVKILGINFNQALFKLGNLEKLLSLTAQQRLYESSRPSGNVLMTFRPSEAIAIEFMKVDSDEKIARRIIVDSSAAAYVDKKCIGELRYREHFQGEYETPQNLMTVSEPIEARSSNIWAGRVYNLLGDASNSNAQHPTAPRTEIATATDLGTSAANDHLEPAPNYMPARQARQIESWAATIPGDVDPENIPVTVPSEAPVRDKRVRRVAVDSDDEEEDVHTAAPGQGQNADVQNLSSPIPQDQIGVPPREVVVPRHTQRKRAVESDDSGDRSTIVDPKQPDTDVLDCEAVSQITSSGVLADTSQEICPITWTTEKESGLSFEQEENIDPSTGMLVDLGEGDDDDDEHEDRGSHITPKSPHAFSGGLLIPMLNTSTAAALDHHRTEVISGAKSTLQQPGTSWPTTTHPVGRPASTLAFDPTKHGQPTRGDWINVTRGRGSSSLTHRRGAGLGHRGNTEVISDTDSRGGAIASASGLSTPSISRRGISNARTGGGLEYGRVMTMNSRGRGQPYRAEQSRPRDTLLIHIPNSPAQTSKIVMPPPGFETRSPQQSTYASPPSSEVPNVMDGPVKNVYRTPILQQSPSLLVGDSASWSAQNLTTTSSNSGASYVNTRNPGIQIGYLQNETLASLMELREVEERHAAEQTARNSEPRSRPGRRRRERVQAYDEVSTRTYRDTMNQNAGNPGKKSKGVKQETAKEKADRIAKAKAEAHGTVPSSKTLSKVTQRTDPLKEPSAKKKPLIKKNLEVSKDLSGAAEQIFNSVQTEDLIEQLRPFFAAGRAFSGQLKFEVQFGQILLPILPVMQEGHCFTVKQWKDLMNPTTGQKPATGFTKILTRNGADLDGVLEMKVPNHDGQTISWDKSSPGPSQVSYEFHCQSKENEEFWLIVDESGNCHLRKATAVVGVVNLHYAERIWDACAVLSGESKWDAPAQINAAAADFVQSLHVPSEKHITITYRLPKTNDMTVRDLHVKRTSLHDCFLMDRQDFQLQVTEVKRLYHRFRKDDKAIGQGFEKEFAIMMDEDRVHYEMSLIHKGINGVLAQNKDLEVGELTDERSTGASLLTRDRVRNMLELTSHVVSRIDWVGARNVGTLIRSAERARAEQDRRNQSTAPHGSVIVGPASLPLPTPFARSAMTSRSIMNPSKAVPGIRQNSSADAYQREDGSRYFLGRGGAQIPIPEEDETAASEVMPDDSASQVGGPRGGAGTQPYGMSHIYPTSPYARPGLNPKAPQQSGYW